MRCHKVRGTLRYHVPSKLLSPKKFVHHVLLLFYPLRHEKELLSDFLPMHQNKLPGENVRDVINIKKKKFEPYGNLLDKAFLHINGNLINNQDSHNQTENDETSRSEYPNESDTEEEETSKTFALPNFMPQILPDDEIAEGINS